MLFYAVSHAHIYSHSIQIYKHRKHTQVSGGGGGGGGGGKVSGGRGGVKYPEGGKVSGGGGGG